MSIFQGIMDYRKVSIIMPYKNTAQYLGECLDSLLSQTYEHWELIAIDDHSVDRSPAVIIEYAKADSRIIPITNKGEGIIPALRTGFARSSGDYITRMDSDDVMDPVKLETMVRSLNRYGRGHVALGQVKYFSSSGISYGYARYENWLNTLTATGSNYDEIYKECVIPSPCWMVFRDDLILCGAFDHDRYPEDYDLAFRFRQNDLKCIPSDKILHLWRDYPARTSRNSIHYAINYFLDIKLHYFLLTDWDAERPLALWGAGTKGKTVAKLLLERKVDFYWLCDNPKKIGKRIYGCEMLPFEVLESVQNSQSIVTVANSEAQKEIRSYFKTLDMKALTDYYFFC